MYPGIDYGRGLTNVDTKTGIRYGVIPHHAVGDAWYEDSVPQYEHNNGDEDCEPMSYLYTGDGYIAEQGHEGCDIFVTMSPYYTYAQHCSPCAPGACYLLNPIDNANDGNRCYCFGHDWFESGKAPYRVFLVETNEEVMD